MPRLDFASDNTAGVCPEALAALAAVNPGHVPSYGEDAETARARTRFDEVFERPVDAFFVFNGTAANSLALAALCQRHHAILCHEFAHIAGDECGAPEFFTGGAKLVTATGPGAKLDPAALAPILHRGHGVHAPKPRAVSITQTTELGTAYTAAEVAALGAFARAEGLALHMDGARFANAVAAAAGRATPADLTWRAGVDVLCFGGTKNGLLGSEVVVFFQPELAREFEYRVKQSGQLASKARYAAAQWNALLADGAWLRHAGHANRQAQRLAAGFTAAGLALVVPPDANGVFVHLPAAVATALEAGGWVFYKFVGDDGYRFMCSWATTDAALADLLAAVRAALAAA